MADGTVPTKRSLFQRLILAFVSPATARDMEAHSRAWKLVCSACGGRTSVWEAGGIRWKARGRSKTLTVLRCSVCGQRTMHRLEHDDTDAG
jgi:translation initiation factor 2 beta subunit (eIF-2beta)/eIF-5